MKLVYDKNIVIYVGKKIIDIDSKEKLEKLINKINQRYNISLRGYYNVYVYIDKNYGLIMEMIKEELDYMDYFNTLEMNIEIIEDSFLYKIDDIYRIKQILSKLIVRKYKDNFYIEIDNIDDIELAIILENTEIIYGKKAKKIKNRSKTINMEVII